MGAGGHHAPAALPPGTHFMQIQLERENMHDRIRVACYLRTYKGVFIQNLVILIAKI